MFLKDLETKFFSLCGRPRKIEIRVLGLLLGVEIFPFQKEIFLKTLVFSEKNQLSERVKLCVSNNERKENKRFSPFLSFGKNFSVELSQKIPLVFPAQVCEEIEKFGRLARLWAILLKHGVNKNLSNSKKIS